MSWIDALALSLTAAGVVSAGIATFLLRDARSGLAIGLDLWTAAGLLRLTGGPSLSHIASAVVIMAVRKMVLFGLRQNPTWPR